jgi:hypothetical protein
MRNENTLFSSSGPIVYSVLSKALSKHRPTVPWACIPSPFTKNRIALRSSRPTATFDGQAAEITRDGATARVAFLPQATDSVGWSIQFEW